MTELYDRGLERCRRGDWKEGLVDLALAAKRGRRSEVPGLCYSYLGYGMARFAGDVEEGLRLCRRAIRLEFYQTESYLNLARTALLSKQHRREAAHAVAEGLRIDPEDPELLRLQAELGRRRPPVVRFFSRRHFVNRILGWFRHQFSPAPKTPADDPD